MFDDPVARVSCLNFSQAAVWALCDYTFYLNCQRWTGIIPTYSPVLTLWSSDSWLAALRNAFHRKWSKIILVLLLKRCRVVLSSITALRSRHEPVNRCIDLNVICDRWLFALKSADTMDVSCFRNSSLSDVNEVWRIRNGYKKANYANKGFFMTAINNTVASNNAMALKSGGHRVLLAPCGCGGVERELKTVVINRACCMLH